MTNVLQPKMAGSPDIVNNEARSANVADSGIKPKELPTNTNGKYVISNDVNRVDEVDEHITSEGFEGWDTYSPLGELIERNILKNRIYEYSK